LNLKLEFETLEIIRTRVRGSNSNSVLVYFETYIIQLASKKLDSTQLASNSKTEPSISSCRYLVSRKQDRTFTLFRLFVSTVAINLLIITRIVSFPKCVNLLLFVSTVAIICHKFVNYNSYCFIPQTFQLTLSRM
jgi:hypothetical protein